MKTTKKVLCTVLYVVSAILIVCSVLSLFRNSSVHYFKMLDFPRTLFLCASLFCVILLLVTSNLRAWHTKLLSAGLICGIFINTFFLYNYTQLVEVEVPGTENAKGLKDHLSVLLTNVKMSNRQSEPLIKLIAEKNPDLILGMEIDSWWDQKLNFLKKDYPYSQRTINSKTYGMVLYSKFPLQNIQVNYLNNADVPSFECLVTLDSGQMIDLHCLHPVPPTNFEDLPDNVGQKEIAMKKLGKELQNVKYPVMIAGDLNDVVWARVDNLTGTENILFDVRVGRGLFNSFNAQNPFLRWPLDHIFVSKQFHLQKFEILPEIGSDHFPVYAELAL